MRARTASALTAGYQLVLGGNPRRAASAPDQATRLAVPLGLCPPDSCRRWDAALITRVIRASMDYALVLHAAGVSRQERSYLFLAPSGGGKSTLSAICDSEGLSVFGDDQTLVLEKQGAFYLRPMPRVACAPVAWLDMGEHCLIRRAFFLSKSREPSVSPIAPLAAVRRCLIQDQVTALMFMTPEERRGVLDRVLRLFLAVPAYELRFRKDSSFWEVIDELEEEEQVRA